MGLKIIEPLKDDPHQAQRPHMPEEKKDEGVGDPIKLFLEEALAQHRDEMMNNFSQILWRLSIVVDASTSNIHFGGAIPFKVQINFDIPVFEGKIDVDAVEKWVNMLEVYFSIYNFYDRENITFTLLKAILHVKDWWETYCEQTSREESEMFGIEPTWASFLYALKGQYYPIENYENQ